MVSKQHLSFIILIISIVFGTIYRPAKGIIVTEVIREAKTAHHPYGGGSIMLWGWFSLAGAVMLFRVNAEMGVAIYSAKLGRKKLLEGAKVLRMGQRFSRT